MTDKPLAWQDAHTEKQNLFFRWMGECVSAWAFADESVFKAFWKCVGPYEQCAIIYYRIQSLDTRMNLADEIVLSRLPKPDRQNGGKDHPHAARWKSIKKDFTGLLGTRARIAHQQVYVSIFATEIDSNGDPTDGAIMSTAFEIYASAHERMRATGSVYIRDYPKPGLTLDDLKDHHAAVTNITDRLTAFHDEILSTLPE